MLVPFELEAIRVVNRATSLHTKQSIMRTTVFAMCVVAVVGRQKWCAKFLADFNEFRICFNLQWNAVVLKFNKKIIFTENIL